MLEKLSARDKKALIVLAIFTVFMVIFLGGGKISDSWAQTRQSCRLAREELRELAGSGAAGPVTTAPGFEFPENGGEEQILAFRDALNEQFRRAGINSEPLQVMPASDSETVNGSQLVRVQATGQSSFGQVLQLFAGLYENPYLMGLDRFKISIDQSRGNQTSLEMTVLTLTK